MLENTLNRHQTTRQVLILQDFMGDLFYVTLSGHLGVCVSLMFEIESGCGVTVFEMEERLTA